MRLETAKYATVLVAVLALMSCAQGGQETAAEPAADAPQADAPAAAPDVADAPDAASAGDTTATGDGDYAFSAEAGDMQFLWTVAGDQLDIKLIAKSEGWVAIGFNPETGMKGANILIGAAKNGEAEVQDHFGILRTNHKADDKVGGASQVTKVSGSESNGTTELAFSIPLDSGDANDGALDPAAETTVLLAYGKSDAMVIRHKFHAVLSVNLASGDYQVVRVGD